MSWMFRWLELLVTRLPRARGAGDRWVEPSNAITRAILSNAVAPLPAMAPTVAVAEEVTEVAAPEVRETRTGRRSRRRRSARAA